MVLKKFDFFGDLKVQLLDEYFTGHQSLKLS